MSCSIENCDRRPEVRGWCRMHYKRWLRCGSPHVVRKIARGASPVCSIDGCARPYHSNGLCSFHDGRRRYHGDPLAGGAERMVGADPAIRFATHVDARGPDECWPWDAHVSTSGYGRFFVRPGVVKQAHRFALEVALGHPIPDELDVDHTCHNADLSCAGGTGCAHRRCCNPAHLEPVTHRENVRRGRVSTRTGPN